MIIIMVTMKDERLPKRSETKKQVLRLQKTRKTTAKMGGLCEDRSEKVSKTDLRKSVEEESGEKIPTTGTNGNKLQKYMPCSRVTSRLASPLPFWKPGEVQEQ